MPPRIPVRFPWSSRTINCSLNGSTSTTTSLCLRTFSSTPTTLALGPQSPNYIDVPKPLQPTYPQDPPVKGHLPIPRDIFKTRNHNAKHSAQFLDSSTPAPASPKRPGPYSKDAAYQLYKQRLAERRRVNLRSGVAELHDRKLATDAAFEAKLAASYADKRARAFAPPLETDLLTANSLHKGVRDYLASTLPPSSKTATIPKRRVAYQKRVARQEAVRANRLHDLYVNAREFMVEEAQLDEAIEKVFGTEEEPIGWGIDGSAGLRSEGKEGLSPWHGPMPEGVGDMLQKLKGGEGVGLAKERVRKVAEELTGGKM
ncbi:hypothetical protein DE146DRAFT_651367 [Phaeosphaeria sp. MPI-PUGE-AT-0046c]|nr:hypothetical protein DE146DRAFT_651367 [Phaeosphaeria sp. MPI-PUGE-AT-0046c]